MKLNLDCIRDILIAVESMDYGTIWKFNDLTNNLPSYSASELQYHCQKLTEAGFLDTLSVRTFTSPCEICTINDLTYDGHQFLADIRSDSNWIKTKEIAKNVGSVSLHNIHDIAINVITTIKNDYTPPHTSTPSISQGANSIYIAGSNNNITDNYNQISLDIKNSELTPEIKELLQSLIDEMNNPHLSEENKKNKIIDFLKEVTSNTLSEVSSAVLTFLLSSLFLK